MPGEVNFIAAIAESPDDDAPCLVFADWLEERGDTARSEFIRVQCQLARMAPADARYPDLHLRQLELLAAHENEWLGEWSQRLVRWEFKRGLLNTVTITPDPFIRHGNELFARHPVRRVAFVNDQGESLEAKAVRAVVSADAMRHVRALETAGGRPDEPMWGMFGGEVFTNAWLTALIHAKHVTHLEEVSLAGGTRMGREAIDLAVWRDFCQARHLRTLRRLDLSDAYEQEEPDSLVQISDALAQARFAKGLRMLSLTGCLVTEEAVRRLITGSNFSSLADLDLSGCNLLRADGVRAILETHALPFLSSLGLPYGLDMRQLASSPALARLGCLRLSGLASGGVAMGVGNRMEPLGRRVEDNEWEAFFRSTYLQNLTDLTVSANARIPSEAIAALLEAPWAVNLRQLRLTCHPTGPDCFDPLLSRQVDGPTPLHSLKLPCSDGIGKALAAWPGLAGITDLVFDHQSAEDTRDLLRSSFLSSRLGRLDLTESCGTLENVRLLAASSALRGLRWLGFGYNRLTHEKMAAFLASPPLRHLESLHMGSENDWQEASAGSSEAALRFLARSKDPPRLRDVVIGSETPEGALEALSKRFGPRLRVWTDC